MRMSEICFADENVRKLDRSRLTSTTTGNMWKFYIYNYLHMYIKKKQPDWVEYIQRPH